MKILQIHNRYQFPGGEDEVAAAERQLLQENGNEVFLFERQNQEINHYGLRKKASLFFKPTWSFSAKREVATILRTHSIDVAHLHNYFPLVSPSIIYACYEARVPIVYSLHNWRLLCSSGLFYRDGRPCTLCVKRRFFPAIKYACYHGSRLQTASVVLMQLIHWYLRTWQDLVAVFIAPSQFVKEWFVKASIPEEKIVVKPHFVQAGAKGSNGTGKYAIFAGRLVQNKGIFELLEAWKTIDLPLKIAGNGPQEREVRDYLEKWNLKHVELCGQLANDKVIDYIKNSLFLIVPSLHYEGFAKVVIEAFSCGVPVIASKCAPLTELVFNGTNGLLFEPGYQLIFPQK